MCNVLILMKPAWIDNLPTEQMKCKGGDVFGLIVDQITELILEWASWVANKLMDIIEPVNIHPFKFEHTDTNIQTHA